MNMIFKDCKDEFRSKARMNQLMLVKLTRWKKRLKRFFGILLKSLTFPSQRTLVKTRAQNPLF